MNNVERVTVFNTETEETGVIRRSLFESEVFNPGGLLLLEIEDTRSGCVDCGVEPSYVPEHDEDADEADLEDELPDEEED
jgi:hypothetical protein